jgi:hypothetical protein
MTFSTLKRLAWLLPALLPLWAMAADLTPPALPDREKNELTSASGVALDMAKSIAFMEQGQAYYKAYAKGSHNAAENKAFVRFAEDYDRELNNVRKELDVLRIWVDKKSDLKPD